MSMKRNVKDVVHLLSQLRSVRIYLGFIFRVHNMYLKISLGYTDIELTMTGQQLPEQRKWWKWKKHASQTWIKILPLLWSWLKARKSNLIHIKDGNGVTSPAIPNLKNWRTFNVIVQENLHGFVSVFHYWIPIKQVLNLICVFWLWQAI